MPGPEPTPARPTVQRVEQLGTTGAASADDDGERRVGKGSRCHIETEPVVLLSVPAAADAATDVSMLDGTVEARVENVSEQVVVVKLWTEHSKDGTLGKSGAVTVELDPAEVEVVDVPAFANALTQLAELDYAAALKVRGHMYVYRDNSNTERRYVGGLVHLGLWAYRHPTLGPIYFNDEALAERHNAGDLLGQHTADALADGSSGHLIALEEGKYYGDPEDPRE